jgi:hypothetical protein
MARNSNKPQGAVALCCKYSGTAWDILALCQCTSNPIHGMYNPVYNQL